MVLEAEVQATPAAAVADDGPASGTAPPVGDVLSDKMTALDESLDAVLGNVVVTAPDETMTAAGGEGGADGLDSALPAPDPNDSSDGSSWQWLLGVATFVAAEVTQFALFITRGEVKEVPRGDRPRLDRPEDGSREDN